MITLKRESTYADSLRLYEVSIDGKIIGKIADGEVASYDVTPGKHIIYVKIAWTRSRKIEFEVPATQAAHFRCKSHMTGIRSWTAIFYIILMPHRYIELELLDKKGNA